MTSLHTKQQQFEPLHLNSTRSPRNAIIAFLGTSKDYILLMHGKTKLMNWIPFRPFFPHHREVCIQQPLSKPLAWSQDGEKIAVFVSLRERWWHKKRTVLCIADCYTKRIRVVAEGNFDTTSVPTWTPDDSAIAFTLIPSGEVCITPL